MELVYAANKWFDRVPEDRRFPLIVVVVMFSGVINMMLSISGRFPFGLLVLLTMAVIAALRVPYLWGWIEAPAADADKPPVRMIEADWLHDANTWYDGIPEATRVFLIPAVLIVAGALNMRLTITHGFPFGLLVLIVLAAILALRVPFVQGWVKAPATPAAPDTTPRMMPPLAEPRLVTEERTLPVIEARQGHGSALDPPGPGAPDPVT